MTGTAVEILRDVRALQIPSGEAFTLRAGTPVIVTQTLGGTYTVQAPSLGGLFRIDGKDGDALGFTGTSADDEAPRAKAERGDAGPVDEEKVYDALRTCYDPEIPVNIVDLGLVYDLQITPLPRGGNRVDVKMTLTAPGCGMGTAIAADARAKIEQLAGVKEADVAVVWDPPWSAEMMSEAGKKRLGIQ